MIPDAALSDTVPCCLTADKFRRRPSPERASALMSWGTETERPVQATDESDGGIGVNMPLGLAPRVGTEVILRYRDGEARTAIVRHIMPDGGCIHLGLAWIATS